MIKTSWIKDIQCNCGGFLQTTYNNKCKISCNKCAKESQGKDLVQAIKKYKNNIGAISMWTISKQKQKIKKLI